MIPGPHYRQGSSMGVGALCTSHIPSSRHATWIIPTNMKSQRLLYFPHLPRGGLKTSRFGLLSCCQPRRPDGKGPRPAKTFLTSVTPDSDITLVVRCRVRLDYNTRQEVACATTSPWYITCHCHSAGKPRQSESYDASYHWGSPDGGL